jgi:hypothetical protein
VKNNVSKRTTPKKKARLGLWRTVLRCFGMVRVFLEGEEPGLYELGA